ncbi:MAG: glyoxalase [Myxococcales bacterium]|nr:glyoxalase [Myxococcales bacterium]
MQLGAFSISLSVKDVKASRDFYAKLGFEVKGGDVEQNWLILANGETRIGLFQGMFDKNTLTFNPGLNNRKERLDAFTDVRALQDHLEAQGLELTQRVADGNTEGAAHIALLDPDGNPILIDQFF